MKYNNYIRFVVTWYDDTKGQRVVEDIVEVPMWTLKGNIRHMECGKWLAMFYELYADRPDLHIDITFIEDK